MLLALPPLSPLAPHMLRPVPRYLLISVAIIAIALIADSWAWAHIVDARVYERDWGRMLRVMGFLPFWLVAALALALEDRGRVSMRDASGETVHQGWRSWARRGGLIVLSAGLGGLVAEVGKLIVRRERPGDTSAAYTFRAFADRPFDNRGLGMPSSHALVAFGAAAMLARLFPRARWIWFLLAAGCAYTRVAARAHYLSDVAVAAVLGYAVAWALWRRSGAERATEPGRSAASP